MDAERQFNDLGIDAIMGTQLMHMAGINSDDFIDGFRFNQFKDIIAYFKSHPEYSIPEIGHLIDRISVGKPVDRLQHIWSYLELQKKKEACSQELDEIQARKEQMEKEWKPEDFEYDINMKKVADEYANKSKEIGQVTEQIGYYER